MYYYLKDTLTGTYNKTKEIVTSTCKAVSKIGELSTVSQAVTSSDSEGETRSPRVRRAKEANHEPQELEQKDYQARTVELDRGQKSYIKLGLGQFTNERETHNKEKPNYSEEENVSENQIRQTNRCYELNPESLGECSSSLLTTSNNRIINPLLNNSFNQSAENASGLVKKLTTAEIERFEGLLDKCLTEKEGRRFKVSENDAKFIANFIKKLLSDKEFGKANVEKKNKLIKEIKSLFKNKNRNTENIEKLNNQLFNVGFLAIIHEIHKDNKEIDKALGVIDKLVKNNPKNYLAIIFYVNTGIAAEASRDQLFVDFTNSGIERNQFVKLMSIIKKSFTVSRLLNGKDIQSAMSKNSKTKEFYEQIDKVRKKLKILQNKAVSIVEESPGIITEDYYLPEITQTKFSNSLPGNFNSAVEPTPLQIELMKSKTTISALNTREYFMSVIESDQMTDVTHRLEEKPRILVKSTESSYVSSEEEKTRSESSSARSSGECSTSSESESESDTEDPSSGQEISKFDLYTP